MRPLFFAIALATVSLLLAGCLGGNSGAGAVISGEGKEAKEAKAIEVPADALFSLPSSVTSADATPEAGEATPTPAPTATPKPKATPTPAPEPTPTPVPAPAFPPRLQPDGALSGTYYATCIYSEKPSCGEFFTRLVTAGMTFYNPENKEHRKNRSYFFFTSNDWTGAVRITQEMNTKYSPFDNTMGVFGYGSTISYPE